ncbi:hypothetical protein [Natrononativus amylolyticus]|uniref:hypothetical protein n=1 Tax=Natrononativus amylolyticus TaxID=2963434 RepID=UPI0020CB881B|nr:hypothetical protein [Natrononativus amylolyticus]
MTQDGSGVDGIQETTLAVVRSVADAVEPVLGERPTMEHVLLLLFLVTGIYMYYGAREFSPAAAEFPQVMAGLTIILSVLLLARNYLTVVGPVMLAALGLYAVYTGATTYLETGDGLLRTVVGLVFVIVSVVYREQVGQSAESFVAEPMQIMGEEDMDLPGGDAEEDDLEESAEDGDGSGAMYTYDIDDPRGPVVTGVLCIAYMLVTFAIGMLYATPLFVAAWALWVRMELLRAVALTFISFASAHLFYEYIQSDIAEGWLTGWEPTPPDVLLEPITEPLFDLIGQVLDQLFDAVGLSTQVVDVLVVILA